MITLTRISGSVFALNADLIERIDATPDTVITLVDGKKYVVAESLSEVMEAIRLHRSEVIALSSHLLTEPLVPVQLVASSSAPSSPALAPVARLHEDA